MFSPSKYRIHEIVLTMRAVHDYRMENRNERDQQCGAKIRTLIVDDSAALLTKLRELLATIPQVKVVGEARNGEEALLQAQRLRPDLVIMDVHMPVMDGLEAAREMETLFPEMFVILASAFTHIETLHLPPLRSAEFASKSRLWDVLLRLLSARFPNRF